MTVSEVKELANMGFTHDEIMQLITAEDPAADPAPAPEAKPEPAPAPEPTPAPAPTPAPEPASAPTPAPNNMEVLMQQLLNETRSMKAAIQNNNTVAAMVGNPTKESASDILASIINPTFNKEGDK